jgi:hypothetical protein
MKSPFNNLMLLVAMVSAAISSSVQAGALDSREADLPQVASAVSIGDGTEAQPLESTTLSSLVMAEPTHWAQDLLTRSLSESSRLDTPKSPQPASTPFMRPLVSKSPLDEVRQLQVDVTRLGLAGELLEVASREPAVSPVGSADNGLREVHALISTMGNGIINDSDSMTSIASEGEESARIDNNEDWSADDPTSEYLDFNYRAYDFKQFFDTNSNTVAVKVDINQLVDNTPVSIDLDHVFDDLFNEDKQSSDTLADNFDTPTAGSLDNFAATPEPSSMLMMCFGMLFFGLNNRRQRRRSRMLGLAGSSMTG